MRFCRYVLRTTNVDAARSFYASVLGEGAAMVALHEAAIERGARPHWLGVVGVDDPDGMANAFVEHGATRLGPTAEDRDGPFAIVRDPGGAVVAIGASSELRGPRVAWHILNTLDLPHAASSYASLFGWYIDGVVHVGDDTFHEFAYARGLSPVGALTDIAGRADRHAHWLYFFAVPDLDAMVAHIRALGGKAMIPPHKPDVAMCEDGQGAAFGLATLTA